MHRCLSNIIFLRKNEMSSKGDVILLIRKAKISDVEAIHRLINYYAAAGEMLARARATLYEGIREFSVVEIDRQIVAVGSLHILWCDLAEIRALAGDPAYIRRHSTGKNIPGRSQRVRTTESFRLNLQAGLF